MSVERASRFVVGALARGVYRLDVEGREHLPESGPAVIVANHRSYVDPFFLGYALKDVPRFVATVRVFRNPFTRWFCQKLETIPTKRGGADPRAVRGVLRTLSRGGQVGIFPEGERSWNGAPLPLLPGVVKLLARAGAPVVPASLLGTYEAWPRWAPQPRLARVRVVFGPPIPAADLEPDLLGGRLEESIHGPVVEAGPTRVRGFGLARGLGRLVWWCPACAGVGHLQEVAGEILRCDLCVAEYRLDERYRLIGPAPGGGPVVRRPLDWWVGGGPPELPAEEPEREELSWLDAGERVYLRAEATLLEGRYPTIEDRGRGRVVLTDQRFRFMRPPLHEDLWTETVNTIVIEGPEVLQVGAPDRMWRLWLPGDSALKWQTYLEALYDIHHRSHRIPEDRGVEARAG